MERATNHNTHAAPAAAGPRSRPPDSLKLRRKCCSHEIPAIETRTTEKYLNKIIPPAASSFGAPLALLSKAINYFTGYVTSTAGRDSLAVS